MYVHMLILVNDHTVNICVYYICLSTVCICKHFTEAFYATVNSKRVCITQLYGERRSSVVRIALQFLVFGMLVFFLL